MSDWRELAGDWQSQADVPGPSGAELAALAARARREALVWRWKWRLVQASAVALVALTGWIVAFSGRPAAFKILAAFLAVLAAAAWWAARGTMDALVSIDAQSALDHLRAQRARAAAMPRFVVIDLVVYALCAIAFAIVGWGGWPGAGGLGVDVAGRSAAEMLPLWALLAVGTAYDLWRLGRSRATLRRIDAMLAALAAEERG
jgi:hypothetical protein